MYTLLNRWESDVVGKDEKITRMNPFTYYVEMRPNTL